MKAEFKRKESEVNAKEVVIEKVIRLSQLEYDYFTKHMLQDYPFIQENKDLMYEEQNKMHCILAVGIEGSDGVLVESEGSNYARYSAFLPDASVFLQTMQSYPSLEKLNQKLRETVDFIIKDGTEGTSNGGYTTCFDEIQDKIGLEESLMGYVVQMLEEREEVIEAVLTEDGFDVSYYTDYCSYCEEEPEEIEPETLSIQKIQ